MALSIYRQSSRPSFAEATEGKQSSAETRKPETPPQSASGGKQAGKLKPGACHLIDKARDKVRDKDC
jgi:hypothetical protein